MITLQSFGNEFLLELLATLLVAILSWLLAKINGQLSLKVSLAGIAPTWSRVKHFNINRLWRPFLVISGLMLLLLTGLAVADYWQQVYTPKMSVSLFFNHVEFVVQRVFIMVGLVLGYVLVGWNNL